MNKEFKNTIKKRIKQSSLYIPIWNICSFPRLMLDRFGIIRNYVLFPIIAFLRTHKVGKFYEGYERLDSYRGKYSGQRCFILAAAPSLRIEDAERLSNEKTFVLNSFFKLYDRTTFRPTFYVELDPDGEEVYYGEGDFNPGQFAKECAFINDVVKKRKRGYKNTVYLPVNWLDHWVSLYRPGYNPGKNLKHSRDMLWGTYDQWSVTGNTIELAAYMGFSEIYLLGIDNDYNPNVKYATGEAVSKDFNKMDNVKWVHDAMASAYAFLDKETKRYGVHVYNASRGGKLEEFDRVNFDSIDFK